MEVLNTDLFDEELHPVQIGGKTYKISTDISLKLYNKLLRSGADSSFLDGMEKGAEVMCEIFKIYNPDLNEEEFISAITYKKFTALMNFITAEMTIEETKEKLKEAKEALKDGKKKQLQAAN